MSGRTIGTIGGAVIGLVAAYFTGGYINPYNGAMLGAALGGAVGGALDRPKGPNIIGPRLSDINQQTATYGAFIPRVYGKIAIMGNVFWIENNKLKEVATTEGQGGKGGPPEVNTTTYKYYGTFAVGLCEGLDPALYGPGAELVLSKLWVGEKLFYNRSSTDEETILTSIDRETKFKFYSGTEAQLPEPRMEADLGIANTPAYRGLAYLVIYDMDVQAYGNTIAGVQIKAELIAGATFQTENNFRGSASIASGAAKDATVYGQTAIVCDINNNKLLLFDITDGTSPVAKGSVSSVVTRPQKVVSDGQNIFVLSANSANIAVFNVPDGLTPQHLTTLAVPAGVPNNSEIKNDRLYISATTISIWNIKNGFGNIGVVATPSQAFAVAVDGNYLYTVTGSPNTFRVYDISDISSPVQVGSVSLPSLPVHIRAYQGYVYASDNGATIRIINVTTPSSPVVSGTTIQGANIFEIGGSTLYAPVNSSLKQLNIFNLSTPSAPVLVKSINNGVTGAIVARYTQNYIVVLWATQISLYSIIPNIIPPTVTLGDIVKTECLLSRLLTVTDIDVSALTQTVRGYRISSVGSIRGGVEPLQAAWPFDVVQDGYKIKYVPRGGSNVATITYDKLDARGNGAAPGIQISNSREMESQLPAKVSIKYMDINRAYNTGEQYYERINTDAVNHADLEMPIVFNAQEAAGKAQTLAYLYWLERYDISFKLPPEYLQLQPSDVITITTPDASYNLRLKQINYTQDGRLECQAKYNHAALYSPSATGEEGVPPDDTLAPPGTTTYELLDIPCLQDVYNVSGFPVAMTGAKKGWPGGVLARSDDGGASYTTIGAVPSPGAVMGLATNTIGAHNGFLLDKASVLNVKLTKGSLSSVSELQLFNGANHFAYGIDGRWEIIAAQFCVLQGDGSYNLSDFMRGRFGTEIYTGTHAVNDNVIYLASASMLFQALNSSAIGLTRHYKGVNFQSTLDTVSARAFIYNGVNLECLSPVYLNGNRHPTTNDWTLDWIRRGRINNEWKDLIDVPVGETSEAYEIDIYSSSGFTTVLRTLSGLTSATATYTSAQQVTDFGSNQATIHVKVYQLSSSVGRGYPLTQSITR